MKDQALKTKKSNNKFLVQILLATSLMLIAFIISIGVGKYPISVGEILDIILGREVPSMTRKVFFTLRLPRTIMVVIAGLGLSISGSVYQTIFKNPLATPDIIGVSSGANLGAALAISFFAASTLTIASFAFIGGLAAVLIALGLTRVSKNKSITSFVLAGIVIGSTAQGFIMLLKYMADPERQLAAIEYWAMGSFAGITGAKVLSILPFFLLGIIGLFLLKWQINILSLSDEEGKSLGVRVGLVRLVVIVCATLVVASIVSVTGLIAFIGLIGPHIARMITGKNDFNTTVLSGIIGALILLIADTLARSISSSEIPISILTTFVGAPFLGYLMSRLD